MAIGFQPDNTGLFFKPLGILGTSPTPLAGTTAQQVASVKSSTTSTSNPPGSVCQACEKAKSGDTTPPTKNTTCNCEGVVAKIPATVKGGKSKTLTPTNKSQAFEIIGGYQQKIKKLELTLTNPAGPCPKHNDKVFDSRGKFITKSNTQGVIEIPSGDFQFFKEGRFYSLSEYTPKEYAMSAATCGAGATYGVKVYPDVELTVDFALDFNKGSKKPEKSDDNSKDAERKKTTQISAGKKLEYKRDGVTQTFDLAKIEHTIEQCRATVDLVETGRSIVTDIIGSSSEFKVLYPSIHLNLGCKFDDEDNAYFEKDLVYARTSFSFGLQPLIGLSWKFDFLDAAIAALPGGCGIVVVKKAADDFTKNILKKLNIEVELSGDVTIEGKIEGLLIADSLTRIGTSCVPPTNRTKAEGIVKITAALEASVEWETIFFTIKGGLKAKADSGLTGTAQASCDSAGDWFVSLEAKFDGLNIEITKSGAISGPQVQSKPAANQYQNSTSTSINPVEKGKEKAIYSAVLIKPKESGQKIIPLTPKSSKK